VQILPLKKALPAVVVFLVAAQIKKDDEHLYFKVTK
jgi:hypothetical protein